MLKSKFLAGLIATIITIVVLVGLVMIAVMAFDLGPENKVLTYGGAFGSIALWGGIYSWLKPKDAAKDQTQNTASDERYKDGELPPRHTS